MASNSELTSLQEEFESQQYMLKVLNRTLPFDENKAILFIRGQNQDLILSEKKKKKTSSNEEEEQKTSLSFGEEIKDFYDQVIQTIPSTSSDSNNTVQPVLTKTKPITTPVHDHVRRNISINDMFKYAQEGNLDDLCNGLLKGGHDINMRDSYGWSLLMCASCAGHMTIVLYLLENGAVWNGVTDRCGHDAPEIAERSGNHEMAYLIRSFHAKEEEIEHIDSNKTDNFYCETCKLQVSELQEEHNVSTLHQFNCQHLSSPSAYTLPVKNRGFQMMLQSGWDPKTGLGSSGQGRQYPIKTVLKRDRYGLGSGSKQRARVTHFRPGDVKAVSNSRKWTKKELTKRERNKLLQNEKRWEIDLRTYMNSDY